MTASDKSGAPARGERPVYALTLAAGSHAIITVGDALSKLAVASVSIPQVFALRGAVVLLLLSPLMLAAWRRGEAVFATRNLLLHAIRAVFAIVSIAAFFQGLREVPLATAIAISFVSPLVVALLGIVFLGEKVDRLRWTAIAIGFLGCLLILQPGGAGFEPAMLYPAAAATAFSVVLVTVRRLTATDSMLTILFWFNLMVTVFGAVASFWFWHPMDQTLWLLLGLMGVLQILSQALNVASYRWARAATVAPVQYTTLFWAALIGWIYWQEWPGPRVWAGAAIIAAAGLILIRAAMRDQHAENASV